MFFIVDFQKLSAELPVHFWLKKCCGVKLNYFREKMSKIITFTQNLQYLAINAYSQNQLVSILPLITSNLDTKKRFIGEGSGAYFEIGITRNKLGNAGFELDFDNYTPMGNNADGSETRLQYCFPIDLLARQTVAGNINHLQWTFARLKGASATTLIKMRVEDEILQYLKWSEGVTIDNENV